MGNITQLSQGNLDGLKKQVCECIENAYNAGLKKGLENLKNTRPEETENYKLGYKLGYEKGERHKKELWETALNEAKADGYKTGYDTAIENSQGRREGFDNGYNKGYDRGYGVGFNEGLENARQVILKLLDINSIEYARIFNDTDMYYTKIILEHYSITEIESKIKAYEEKKKDEEEIKVGDEVRDLFTDNRGVVMSIGELIVYITNNGVYTNALGSLEKTGRHFDEVGQLLDKLKGDK